MAFTLVTTQTIIARNAGVLYGVEAGSADMATFAGMAGSTAASQNAFLNAVYTASVGTTAIPTVAAQVVLGLGIPTSTVATSAYQIALAYVIAQLNSAVATGNQGATINNILSLFSGLTADATFGTYATAFNNQVANALTYAQTPGNITNTNFAGVSNVGGTTFTLTTVIDTLVGTASNDTFVATDTGSNGGNTLGSLDSIDGGAGVNTLNISSAWNINTQAGVSIKNIQVANLRSGLDINEDTSTWAGLTTLNATQGRYANLTAATTTDVNVTGMTDQVTVNGGNNVTVTEAESTHNNDVFVDGSAGAVVVNQNANNNVSVGTNTAVKGSVTVNDTNFNGSQILIDGGTNITVNATNAENYAYIRVGDYSATQPTGTVTITETSAATSQSNTTVNASDDIYVIGGTVDIVTEHAAASTSAAKGTALETSNQGYVNIENNKGTTTSVSVTQDAAVAGNAYTAGTNLVAATTAASSGFSSITGTGFINYNGLIFTAYAGTTAAQSAAAFANLKTNATQGSSTLGSYSGTYIGLGTAAASTVSGVSSVLETTAAAVAAVAAVAGIQSVNNDGVGVYDAIDWSSTATDSITSVTATNASWIDVYGTALTNLTTTNVAGEIYLYNSDHASTVKNTVATTLNLAANGDTGDLYDNNSQYKTLNITTSGADSSLIGSRLIAVTALTVSGTQAVNLSGSSLTALKTVVVTGAAGLTIDASGANVTDVNAAATSGNMTVTIDASKATYKGGTGNDLVTVMANVSKAISLGAGNNSLTLNSLSAAITASINGGSGTADTLAMAATLAATDSLTTVFAGSVTGFEHLTLNDGGADAMVDLAVLGGYNYVTDAATGFYNLTLENMASGGTVAYNGSGSGLLTVDRTVASTASNLLNINFAADGGVSDAITTTSNAHITSVTVAANDTTRNVKADVNADTLTLTDAALTTITVTGNAHLILNSANSAVTSVNASAMTGGLTYMTAGTVAETVTGGAGHNVLTAHSGSVADMLIGGTGNDTLTANAGLDILTGNGGNDTFVINTPSINVNSYATITDANVGDVIQFAGLTIFSQAQTILGGTAVFQDYANAAVTTSAPDAGKAAWFQFGGNTYIVEHNVIGAETSFTNGTDSIVKLLGLVDLSHTSLNATNGTLLIG